MAMVLVFFCYSFDIYQSIILTSVMILSIFGARSVYFDESFKIGSYILTNLTMCLAVSAIQGIFNKISFVVIEKDVLYEGND